MEASAGQNDGVTGRARAAWMRLVVAPVDEAERDRDEAPAAARSRARRRAAIVCLTAALCLTLLEYFGMANESARFAWLLDAVGLPGPADALREAMRFSIDARYNRMVYWAVWCTVVYAVIPLLVVRFVLREPLSSVGWSLRGIGRDVPIYGAMLAVVLPLVWVMSGTPHFLDTYPFYDPRNDASLWPRFWTFEALYALQFVSLEFFFRGFLLQGTRGALGYFAVFAAMIPYVMIHFGKPLPETLGAIIAGLVLGHLALKSRSVWLGIATHVIVATSMDFAALLRRGYFG
jgi:membrane protease YdiL (CAAX protease family)